MSDTYDLEATLSGSGSITGSVSGSQSLNAGVSGGETVNGNAGGSYEMSGNLAGNETMHGSVGGSSEMEATLSGQLSVRGRLSGLKTLRGYSAYEVAVIHGFRGTVEEWLASLKGGGTTAKIGWVNLLASAWTASEVSEHLYFQSVDIEGVTERSQVDLTPSVDQLVAFYEKDLTFVTENDGGEVTVYAIGQKPTKDYPIQVTITEVSV